MSGNRRNHRGLRTRLVEASILGACASTLAVSSAAGSALAAGASAIPPNTCQGDNFSPSTRTLVPESVYAVTGTVSQPSALLSGSTTRIQGADSALTLDFGKEVGGLVTLQFAGASDANQSLGLAFTESSEFVGITSDASNGGSGPDGAISAPVTGAGTYTMPADKLRGGFRYLTLFLQSSGWVDVSGLSLAFTPAPDYPDPAAYPNYFCSSDELLNRIWYAGAYTVQLDTIDPTQGRVWGPPASGWENNGVVGTGTSVLVDGAKRDRTVWPGDMGVAVPTDFVSIDDMTSVRNSLDVMYAHQDSFGAFPYAGPEVNFDGTSSDTYHMWTLLGTATYVLDTGDLNWFSGVYSQYQKGVEYSLAHTDPAGLYAVTGGSDWFPSRTGETVEANAMFYDVLVTGTALATAENDTVTATLYSTKATQLRTSINNLLWDSTKGAYHDNVSSSALAYPQDGNSLAVLFGVPDTTAKVQSVMQYLIGNWNAHGASTPEWSGNDHPFPGSFEVLSHFVAGDDINGLALIRREWGYMLDAPIGTGSTFWEGYNADGSLGYNAGFTGAPPGIYTSLAHGWATGPTSALTNDVLGIAPVTFGGATYQVVPHHGDLAHAQGRLSLPVGAVDASWDSVPTQGFALTVEAADTGSATATVAVPRDGSDRAVSINGVEAWDGTTFLGSPGISAAHEDATYIYFTGVSAADRTFTWGEVLNAQIPETPWPAVLPLMSLALLLTVGLRRKAQR